MGKPNEHGVTLDGEEDFSKWAWKEADGEPDADDLADELVRLGKALKRYHSRKQETAVDNAKLVISELARDCSINLGISECPEHATLELWFFDTSLALSARFLDVIDRAIGDYLTDDGHADPEDRQRFIDTLEAALARVKAMALRDE